ncbi:hypothetical protein M409DRAFT_36953 [Zasmidium cellare ATCC 36951]|uniref:FAD/NAD(P)-binding domain-containing protein n=1 Tax=Zasmidium cellare ATCC 36951 TaxID=1080233 RepID=A0A6A6CES3_ZASCE|nr:uncharacterized protein M409DRAFT_36953 [Zasmidium cellare ATCC 36951]KAF2165561.1 hypothetical protein M409DRAFT_36953 [Zasmidium cellare ATCC 36951]
MSSETRAFDADNSVAIVGAGALGLVATKNLIEEGFDVTTFEKNTYVGGLWHVNGDSNVTSALVGTVSNGSKQASAFSDFPMPDSFPTYPNAAQFEEYFDAYADHFDLRRSISFSTTVTSIARDEMKKKWVVGFRPSTGNIEKSQSQEFERLIMATGSNNIAHIPQVKGIERFEGEIIHSQALKDPSRFKGKAVLVLGISNSAADSIQLLAEAGAARLYVSHRRKFVTVPRAPHGKTLDCYLSLRNQIIGSWIQWLAPSFQAWLMTKFLETLQYQNSPKLRNHACQRDRKFPPHGQFVPVISENLATNLTEWRIQSVHAIEEVVGAGRVRLRDGEELEDIDVVLFCTGLHPDLASMLPPSADPYNPAHAPAIFATLPTEYVKDRRVCRAYRGFLSLQHPHSLAFLGAVLSLRAAFPFYDLITMALAQLWSGKAPMPTDKEMQVSADTHLKLLANTMQMHGEVQHAGTIDHFAMDAWLHRTAGTGLLSSVGIFNRKAWVLYWTEPDLYKALLDGPPTAHALRLFETGGRRAWPGAKSAILKAYADSKELGIKFQSKEQAKML